MQSFQRNQQRFRGGWMLTLGALTVALAGAAPAWPQAAAGGDGVKLESVPYQGWKNNLRLSNGDASRSSTASRTAAASRWNCHRGR
jgi:hypothetical protein